MFSQGEVGRTIDEHVATACSEGQNILNASLWVVVGEWSAALTDCAQWLNGVGNGARYDGSYESTLTNTCENRWNISTWSQTDMQNSRKYVEAQLDAYEQGLGWIFWCWKTENAVEWDFQKLIAAGIIPQPLTARNYPNQCNFS